MNCSHLLRRARTRWVTERIASAQAMARRLASGIKRRNDRLEWCVAHELLGSGESAPIEKLWERQLFYLLTPALMGDTCAGPAVLPAQFEPLSDPLQTASDAKVRFCLDNCRQLALSFAHQWRKMHRKCARTRKNQFCFTRAPYKTIRVPKSNLSI